MFGPFNAYARRYRFRILLGILAITVGSGAANYIPVLVGETVDQLGRDDLTDELLLNSVFSQVLAIVSFALLVAISGYSMRRLLGTASTRIEYDIRVSYFAHLLRLPLSYYQTQRTGDLMARATNDLNAVRIFFTYGVRGIAETTLNIAYSLTFMCMLNWKLALIVLVPLPLFSLFIIRMAALVHTRFKAIQENFGQMSNFIQENLAGTRVVKAYVQGPQQNADFDRLNHQYLDKNQQLIVTRAVYRPLTYLVASIGLGLNLWFGGKAVIDGQFTIGSFVAFNVYLTLLIRPVAYMGWVIDRFQRALVSMRRINEILDVQPDIEDKAPAAPADDAINGTIELRNLTFSYGQDPVLRDISLKIPAGATVGIMGRVGAGKTTLGRLIPRLIEAAPGQLLIDGKPIEDWPLDQLRTAIGYVSQMPFLFSNSLSANIAYGIDGDSPEAIKTAAEQAQIRADIEDFDQGFDTLIGERGVTLSGGQKQRTTLARALIRQPRILILDDALSAVDTHTEEAILGHLRQIMAGRTTLIIAHRVSTLRDADHIIVLDEGGIAEQGRHQDLVKAGGYYAELCTRQQLAAELESL